MILLKRWALVIAMVQLFISQMSICSDNQDVQEVQAVQEELGVNQDVQEVQAVQEELGVNQDVQEVQAVQEELGVISSSSSLGGGGSPFLSKYIVSPFHGNFWVTQGAKLGDVSINQTISVTQKCECRRLCQAQVTCKSMSTTTAVDGTLICDLSKEGGGTALLQGDPYATYIFWEEHLPEHDYVTLMPDGLLYIELSGLILYEEAKIACSRIPGFRLGIYKTEATYNSLFSLWKRNRGTCKFLDLLQVEEKRVWGDGSQFAANEMGPHVQIGPQNIKEGIIVLDNDGSLNDWNSDTHRCQAICQAHPLGENW